jgi:uncharacterized protein YehS (DUF1456 family)
MHNNDILRQVRYIFDYSDDQMKAIFAQADASFSREEITTWLKKEDDEAFAEMNDEQLAMFLNGFINLKRGKKEGPPSPPEKVLNNNIVFRKLKIALDFKDIDILEVFDLVDLKVGKHELSALFRNPKQSQYRECQDQFLRNFLYGLKMKIRPN